MRGPFAVEDALASSTPKGSDNNSPQLENGKLTLNNQPLKKHLDTFDGYKMGAPCVRTSWIYLRNTFTGSINERCVGPK